MNVQDLIEALIREGVASFNNKEFDKAIEMLNQALDTVEDKNTQIQEQMTAQYWLGCCYLGRAMKAKGEEMNKLFGYAVEHYQQQLALAKQLEDKQNCIQQQNYAQAALGRCYFKQAMKTEGEDTINLFGYAVEHYQQQLALAEQLVDEQNSIQEQIYARPWIGRCYFEQAMKGKGEAADQLFWRAIEHFQQWLKLAEQLVDEPNSIQEQNNAQFWIGRCYFEQAMRVKGDVTKMFEQAVKHLQQQLKLTKQLADETNCFQEQINAQHWLGRCYFEQATRAEGESAAKLFELAVEYHQQQLKLAKQLTDEQNSIQQQQDTLSWLGRCYLEQAIKAKGEAADQLFAQAVAYFQKELALAEQLADEQNSFQKQIHTQSWLGCCSLEQAMKTKGKDLDQLFAQAVGYYQQQLGLAEQLIDEQNSLKEQINARFWLGRCYLEQAMRVKGDATKLFEQAIEHQYQWLKLAKQLADKQNSIHSQNSAQSWLGRCYAEQATKAEGEVAAKLFEQAIEHFQQQLTLAKQLADEQNSIQEQNNVQSGLGSCYCGQAMKAEGEVAAKLFKQAVEHRQQQLALAEQLADEQNSIQEQIYAQASLGHCYFEQVMRAEGEAVTKLFGQAVKHFQQWLELTEQMVNKLNRIQEQNNAQYWLGRCYFEQAMKVEGREAAVLFEQAAEHFQQRLERSKQLPLSGNKQNNKSSYLYLRKIYSHQQKWERYFKWKKQEIQENLFENKEGDLTTAISTILAVLNIPPMELGSIPLAHYTSPSVCERLFGIVSDKTNDKGPVDSNKVSPMRIGSSTYMNDPTEGEGLLGLLSLQVLELENKADCPAYNAFFTCFSSRVNDLNQFRLYGKENGVEASGCCLVFNKNGDWLKESDVFASFRSFINKLNEDFEESVEADVADSEDENLPLYQVAYIAYHDEYIAEEKCGKWLLNKNNQSFGIRLKPVGKNPSWHQFRIDKLEEALMELMEKSNNISDEDKKALEYIRYLFKDFAFRDEEEFRLLKIEQIGSDKIEYCETTKSVYLPYADIRDIVDEVILGTNYEKSGKERKAEVFQHLMRKYYPNVKVSLSSLPINANPPIKKD